MQLKSSFLQSLSTPHRLIKAPAKVVNDHLRDKEVSQRVSSMLEEIETKGMEAVLGYARELDGWQSPHLELSRKDLEQSGEELSASLRAGLELGARRTRAFADEQRKCLVDFETELEPGLVVGHRYVPVQSVGAYLPAGRFPLLASAFMTIGVAKSAGVPRVIACTTPRADGTADPAVLYAAYISGVDRIFVLGGVQALASMAFGLLGEPPVDMLVGAGNAYVAEAKRQLFGRVSIDLLAGPSEVAVLADESADPELVAADLLGQSEHGPDSPAALVTTSEELGESVGRIVEEQLQTLKTNDIAGPAWRNHGLILWVDSPLAAIQAMDELAPEHLEIQTKDDEFYLERLKNYGSIFLGPWSTVAYSDKGMAGTNHVLPTAGGARHSAGLSVSRFLKALTFQKVSREATPVLAEAVSTISDYEGMAAHGATATMRLERLRS